MSHAVLFCGRELGTRKAAYGLDLYCVAPLLSQCRRCCRKCASGVQLCLRWPGQCQGSARRGGRPGTGATKLCCSLLYCRIAMQALLQGGAAAECSLALPLLVVHYSEVCCVVLHCIVSASTAGVAAGSAPAGRSCPRGGLGCCRGGCRPGCPYGPGGQLLEPHTAEAIWDQTQ